MILVFHCLIRGLGLLSHAAYPPLTLDVRSLALILSTTLTSHRRGDSPGSDMDHLAPA